MSLEHEATDRPVTFEHFDQSWSLPAKVRYSHLRKMRAQPGNLGIVEALLDDEQLDRLEAIDPDMDELDEFTMAMSKAMGVGDTGNSEPSTPSS